MNRGGAPETACDPAEPRQEFIDAYLDTIAVTGVSMPRWLTSIERAARRRADIHDIEGNPWRCGFWDVMSSVPYIIDESLRRLRFGGTHGTVG
jgi:hypothetical protein